MKIGILYISIGKYSQFWNDFFLSSEKFFIPSVCKKYFVFSDNLNMCIKNTTFYYYSDLGWPGNTLYRFKIFLEHKNDYSDCDYLFFFNGNTLFKRTISIEELIPSASENYLSALSWHVFRNKQNTIYPYERNVASTAYIPMGEGQYYYQGGLNGGRAAEYIQLMEYCMNNIEEDDKYGLVAISNDESHLNKYLLDKKVKVLDTKYGRPEEWHFPFFPKIIFRDKKRILGQDYVRGLKKENKTSRYSISRLLSKILKHWVWK